jgi:hypothetical protein
LYKIVCTLSLCILDGGAAGDGDGAIDGVDVGSRGVDKARVAETSETGEIDVAFVVL